MVRCWNKVIKNTSIASRTLSISLIFNAVLQCASFCKQNLTSLDETHYMVGYLFKVKVVVMFC